MKASLIGAPLQNSPVERLGHYESVPTGLRNVSIGGSGTIGTPRCDRGAIIEPDIHSMRSIRKSGLEPAIRSALYEGPVRLTYYPALYRSRPPQETFAVVKSSDGRDAQVKFRQDKVVIRRDPGAAWEGVLIGQDDVCVRVAGAWIKVAADGAVSRHTDNELAILEADGSILRKTEYEEFTVSADGGTMARRSASRTDAITPNGTVVRLKEDGDG